MASYAVAVDVGGTFTDLIAVDLEQGSVRLAKVPSTPPDFFAGVIAAVSEICSDFAEVRLFLHGTTAHLNAFLERKGAHSALVTTRGFADLYEMRRGARPQAYDLHFQNPSPLIRRRDIFEVGERIDAQGRVLAPLDEGELDSVLATVRARGIRSIAVCFLNSYRNPEHEERAASYLRKKAPQLFVTPSAEVCREWREYERTSTVAMNAYLSPILGTYLRGLREGLRKRGFRQRVHLMQSQGGLIGAEQAESRAVLTLMSGPVGGNVGCRILSRQLEEQNLICVDMGGTSFDISLIVGGESAVSSEKSWAGQPVLAPTVDIHTIGAGGGSIAWLDSGALRVGPRSAGAAPGPACYGRGGKEPTVTDANLILGRLNPERRYGGTIALQPDLALEAVSRLGSALGLSAERMAEGILAVVNAQMANAIRTMTISRGIDPRDFALVAFGGAGPMHAASLAAELGLRRVIIPDSAGAFSAWGMLETDIRHDRAVTCQVSLGRLEPRAVEPHFAQLQRELHEVLREEGVGAGEVQYRRSLDMRYLGQESFINVPLESGRAIDPKIVRDTFETTYRGLFGHSNLSEQVEIVNLRLAAHGPLPVIPRIASVTAGAAGAAARTDMRSAIFGGQKVPTRYLGRDELTVDERYPGPLIIEEPSCTTVVPPAFDAVRLGSGHLLIESKETAA
jgi:N-methylhydantoinase A